jgi:hypothetical protein
MFYSVVTNVFIEGRKEGRKERRKEGRKEERKEEHVLPSGEAAACWWCPCPVAAPNDRYEVEGC